MRHPVAMLTLALAAAGCDGVPITPPAPGPGSPAAERAPDASPTPVIPPNAQYGTLAALWWQWVFSLPPEASPLLDPTGANALGAQPYTSGNVLFLAGTWDNGPAVRHVTVATGTRLFFPVVNAFWGCIGSAEERRGLEAAVVAVSGRSVGEVAALSAVDLERAFVNLFIDTFDPATLTVTIDGRAVRGLQAFRAESPVFTIPSLDLLGYPGAACPDVVTAGYWMLLHPLPPGEHTIRFTATGTAATSALVPLVGRDPNQDVSYVIDVVPGSR